ncbi:hypothetical protein PVAND_014486 [Polypedilum vanderplanki]|uniref:Uncharacterized protein n=1 Tax=Polypedilum vanderplanki TaxID=319348 RepID=A0A9J6BAB9_POLVA|nr:hypothetical protein PVAND_014486 [Polypedilum vanderplanki]
MCDDEDEELNEIHQKYKLLFDYYNQIVMPAMKADVPVLEKIEDKSEEIKFKELTEPLKAFILNSLLEFQGKEVYIKEIADEKALNELTSKQIKEIINDEKILKVFKPLEKFEKFYIERFLITQENEEKLKIFEDISNEILESRIFVLADDRYLGKSKIEKF